MDSVIKYTVTGTVTGADAEDEPMEFVHYSAADTTAEAIENIKHSLEKFGYTLGMHIGVKRSADLIAIDTRTDAIKERMNK